jgi:hypothetical protein
MRPKQKGRRRSTRLRVYYQEGNRLKPGDLLFDGEQPILVISWRTIDRRRVPAIAVPLDARRLRSVEQRPYEYVYRGKPPTP